MSALAAARRLRRLADLLAGSSSADARAHAADLRRWLSDSRKPSLDSILGVSVGPRERDPRSALNLEERDKLLRSLASELLPNNCPAEQACAIAAEWARYFDGPWREQRTWERTPAGEPQATLWRVTRISPAPLSERRIRYILARAHD